MSKIVQGHHPFTKNERKKLEDFTTPITKGEHQILTLVQRYCSKEVSLAFIQNLEIKIAMWRAGFAEIIDYGSIPETIRELDDT